MAEDCPGCVGRGTGATCLMCMRPIPEDKRRTPDSPSEVRADCDQCRAGLPHVHSVNGGDR